jgi:hypothetical protein
VQGLLPVCGVCRGWRRVAASLLFDRPWSRYHTICHPSQLFSLVRAHLHAARAHARTLPPRASCDARSARPGCYIRPSPRAARRPVHSRPPARARRHVTRPPARLPPQSPWPHEGGLLKLFLRREQLSSGLAGLGAKLYRFTLWHGADASAKDARFLLCAVQHSK